MTSKVALRQLIDEVEVEYQRCWKVLSGMKESDGSKNSPAAVKEFLDFQLTLATALFRLDEKYRTLSQEQTALIAKKKSFTPEWFRRRMRALREYQEAIKEVIKLGRALGDAFAWIFYQGERQYLRKHFDHEVLNHTPPGIGGRGELEFIRNVRALHNQLTIYHGTTTFLRIGDVSFVDLKTLRVTAIGEIKTKEIGDSKLRISLYLLWPKESEKKWPTTAAPSQGKSKTTLPSKMQENLGKQLKKMASSFDLSQAMHKLELHHTMHTKELGRVCARLKKTDLVYEQAGDGLLLVGYRNGRMKSLSSRLFVTSKADIHKRLRGIEKHAIKIMDASQANTLTNANSIFVGHLDLKTFPGATPLFWWPIRAEYLRKIFFREVEVITLYNPAHLIRRLRNLGYNVEVSKGRRLPRVSKIVGKAEIEAFGIDYFLNMVRGCLMHEDFVASIFSSILQKVEAGEVLPSTAISFDIQQHF